MLPVRNLKGLYRSALLHLSRSCFRDTAGIGVSSNFAWSHWNKLSMANLFLIPFGLLNTRKSRGNCITDAAMAFGRRKRQLPSFWELPALLLPAPGGHSSNRKRSILAEETQDRAVTLGESLPANGSPPLMDILSVASTFSNFLKSFVQWWV